MMKGHDCEIGLYYGLLEKYDGVPGVMKRANHHYWPKALSKHWEDSNGFVHRLDSRENLISTPSKNFGHIGNGHLVKLGENWSFSIEGDFQKADDNWDVIIDYILSLDVKDCDVDVDFNGRLKGCDIGDFIWDILCEAICSLLVRCPGFRNRQKVGVRAYRPNFLESSSQEIDNLTIVNMIGPYKEMRSCMKGGGKIIIMYADSKEFISGDGFFSNLPAGMMSGGKCLVPILPTVAIGFYRPMSYSTTPRVVSIKLTDEEVNKCNEIAQIYSGNYIFFRSQRPIVNEWFKSGKFLSFPYHKHRWVDNLLESTSNFR